MKVVRSFDAALSIGDKYVKGMSNKLTPPFELSPRALRNTLTYIFKYLHHSCYMLCVSGKSREFVKLENRGTSSIYNDSLKSSVRKLKHNPMITDSQRTYIRKFVDMNNPLRIMQCIVKRFANKDEKENTNEYANAIENLHIPDGVFILSLTDAIILRNDGRHPFTAVVGDLSLGKYDFDVHLPIFSISGQKGYLDMQLPNYDDIQFALGLTSSAKKHTFQTNWNKKTDTRAVFRGGPTGCGYTEKTNARIRIANIKSPLLDAGITVNPGSKTIDSRSLRFDPKYGLGIMNTGIAPASFITMDDQSKYKYIVHIDGNVSAYRLLLSLSTGSLILRVESEYTSWLDAYLRPWLHFIPVNADLSNLLEIIEWCRDNDTQCSTIARTAMNFANTMRTRENILSALEGAFWSAVSRPIPLRINTRNTRKIKLNHRIDIPKLNPSSIMLDDIMLKKSGKSAKRCPNGFRRNIIADVVICERK